MSDDFSEFEKSTESTVDTATLAELDEKVLELLRLEEEYEAASEAKKVADQNCKRAEGEFMALLSRIGRTSYDAEGLAKVTRCMRLSYKTPKDAESKERLFLYIRDKYGGDALLGLTSINAATLNSWANAEMQSPDVSAIPGLEEPTSTEYLQIRKARV